MRVNWIWVGLVVAVVVVPGGVVAQGANVSVTATNAATRAVTPTIKAVGGETAVQVRETLRQRIEAKLGQAKASVTEVRQARIRQYLGVMEKRLTAALDRQDKMASRIGSRLDKLEAAGKDVAAQRAKLDEAKVDLTDARALLSELDDGVEAVFAADDPKTAFEEVRSQVQMIVDKIKEVHGIFVGIVTDIKGMSPVQTEATPTM